jgi:Uri superfamily endonuclease
MLSPGFFNQPDHLQIPSDPGTYLFILRNFSHKKFQIGRWGQIQLKAGYYIYVGSAFGPGGLKARISRHLRIKKTKRWHIDYLRNFMNPFDVWYSRENEQLEHRWAQTLHTMENMKPIQGLGCSDCRCYSHLFWSYTVPDVYQFSSIAGGKPEVCSSHFPDKPVCNKVFRNKGRNP